MASGADDFCHFAADGIAKSNVSYDAVAKESVYAMTGAVEKLGRDHEIERLVLFFQRTDGRNRNDALHSQLFEAINVGAEIQFAGQKLVAARVARQKRDFAAFQRSENVGVGGISEWSLLLDLLRIGRNLACGTDRCRR